MTTNYKPTGYTSVAPYLTVDGAQATIDFLIQVADAVDRYLNQHFADTSLKATITGRVAVDDAWMRGIGDGHFASVIASLISVRF